LEVTAAGRRQSFVRHLYGLCYAVNSGNSQRAAEARRTLARLRRSFAGRAQEAEAYDVVFPHDPPIDEQDLWLLIAGLFALHPHTDNARGRSIGGAMRLLETSRPSAARRFTQLLSVEPAALHHYLRQAVQLLRSSQVPIDYHVLLTDLVTMRESPDKAHEVRLRWARDYHRPNRRRSAAHPTPTDVESADAPKQETL